MKTSIVCLRSRAQCHTDALHAIGGLLVSASEHRRGRPFQRFLNRFKHSRCVGLMVDACPDGVRQRHDLALEKCR